MNTNHKTHSIMKKTFIIIATLFTFFTVQAQENYIVSTLYEPDSCFTFPSTPSYPIPLYLDTLKFDLNQDGNWDVSFHGVFEPTGGNSTWMTLAPNWKFWVEPVSWDTLPIIVDTVLLDPIIIDENLNWYSGNLFFLTSPYGEPPFYCFRHQTEDGIHYGWMHVQGKYCCRCCIRGMGYCTLPNTPIQWGQTEMFGVEENKHETIGKLHPNPTTGLVSVTGETATEVQVYNALGQLVKTVQNTNEVSLEGLPQGVYLLRVSLEGGKVFSDQVVKE